MSLQLELFKKQSRFDTIIYSIISLLLAILAIAIFLLFLSITGNEIILEGLFRNAVAVFFTNPKSTLGIFYWATPLILTGLSVAVAFQAGLFNIGGQGQMILGGVFTAAWSAVIINNIYQALQWSILRKPIFMIPTALLVGFICGGIWGFIPGLLKAKTGAHEVITTIMLNSIASSLVTYLVGSRNYSPFISNEEQRYGQTDQIIQSSRFKPIFPEISQFFNWSFIVAILAIFVIHYLIFKTNFGFQLRAVGLNSEAAEAAGVNIDRMIIVAMSLSGALAGLAGSTYVMGTYPYRYSTGFEGTLGFDGIAVSLIAQNSPLGILLAAIFFGYLAQTRAELDVTEIPPDLIFVFQGWVIIFAVAPVLSQRIFNQMKLLNGDDDDEQNLEEDPPIDKEEQPEKTLTKPQEDD